MFYKNSQVVKTKDPWETHQLSHRECAEHTSPSLDNKSIQKTSRELLQPTRDLLNISFPQWASPWRDYAPLLPGVLYAKENEHFPNPWRNDSDSAFNSQNYQFWELKNSASYICQIKNSLDLQHDCFDELNPSSPFNMK